MVEEEGTFNLDEFKEAAGVEEEEEKRRTLLDVSRATIGKVSPTYKNQALFISSRMCCVVLK